MPTISREAIGARLAEALASLGMSQADLARETGRARSSIHGWLTGRAQPPLEVLARLCADRGLDPADILGVSRPEAHVVALDEEDWSKLPVLLEQVGAGEPILDPAEEPSVHAFNRGWLRRTYGTDDPRHVWLFKVARDHKGESMAPTILPGSVCLVGPLLTTTEGQLAIEDNGIHLLFLGPEHRGQEGFIVKRVQLQPTGLFVYSDNPSPEHRPFLLHVEGDLRQVVRGRIKWVSQEL